MIPKHMSVCWFLKQQGASDGYYSSITNLIPAFKTADQTFCSKELSLGHMGMARAKFIQICIYHNLHDLSLL